MGERQLGQAIAEGVGFRKQFGEGFRAMEGKDRTRAGMRIALVAEKGLCAG